VPAVSIEKACTLLYGSEVKSFLRPVMPCTLTAISRLSVKTTKSRIALKQATTCSPGTSSGATSGPSSCGEAGLSLKTEPLLKSITGSR
jgi:hypothetical protein